MNHTPRRSSYPNLALLLVFSGVAAFSPSGPSWADPTGDTYRMFLDASVMDPVNGTQFGLEGHL